MTQLANRNSRKMRATLATLLILLATGLAGAQESHARSAVGPLPRSDTTGSGTASQASAAASSSLSSPVNCNVLTPPVVGLEISKGQDPNDIASLINDLSARGFSVGTVDIGVGPIPACVDVLIVPGLAQNLALISPYTATDGNVLQAWAASGHGLLLMSDWGSLKDAIQALFQAYGYTLLGGTSGVVSDATDFDPAGPANTWVIYQADNFASHPLLSGAATLELLRSSWFTPTLNAVVTTDADASPPGAPVMAAFFHGAGCVVLAADTNWAIDYDGAYLKANNAQIARQAIAWLDGCGGLALTKAATPNPVQPGQLVTYTLTVTSYYTATLTNVSISDTVPAGTTFVSASTPYAGPDINGAVQWPLGSLTLGETRVVTLVVRTNAGLADGTPITNIAQIASTQGLTDTATAVVRISTAPPLTPTTTASPSRTPTRTQTPTPTPTSACPSQTAYRSDFETTVGSEWSSTSTTVTPSGRHFLGEFGNGTVRLTIACLAPHARISLSFDLFIIRSWDGNIVVQPEDGSVIGPDIWDLSLVGGPTLLRTTFTNHTYWPNFGFRQAYPGIYPGGDYAPRTGATENGTLGYAFGEVPKMDSVYRLKLTFPHSASSLALSFSASGLQSLFDESWGLDNLELEALNWAVYLPLITR